MALSYSKNVITYMQTTMPTTGLTAGEMWYNPDNKTVKKCCKLSNGLYRWFGTQENAKWGPGSDYGYIVGGTLVGATGISTIERISFPFDSGTASAVGNLYTAKWTHETKCNSSNHGYAMGGMNATPSVLLSIDRISFPFDSGTASLVGNLNTSKHAGSGCNSSNYGYAMDGLGFGSIATSSINRITFPFDSGTASYVGNLSGTKYNATGCNSSNYGYCMGGFLGISSSSINRITFPFDSGTASIVGNLSGSKQSSSSFNSSNYGYAIGGWNNTTIAISKIDRIAFPFDSGTASLVGNLTGSRGSSTGCNSSNYGYIITGNNGTIAISKIERISFPFDSGTASLVGNCSSINIGNGAGAGIDGTDFVTLFN